VSRKASAAHRDPAQPAAAPAGGALREPEHFLALTDDAALREALGAAAAGRGTAHYATTSEGFAEQLVLRSGCIGIVDFGAVADSPTAFIERLRAQFPGLVLIAVGSAREQTALTALIADGTVCRFAHRPVSGQRLGLFLDAALRRRETLLSETREVLLADPAALRPRGSRLALWLLLLAAAGATAAWWLQRQHAPSAERGAPAPRRTASPPTEPPPAAPAPTASLPSTTAAAAPIIGPNAAPAAPAPSPAPGTPQGLGPSGDANAGSDPLTRARHEALLARRLMDVGLLVDPPGNSARTHVDAAMKLAPQDPEVRRVARALSGRLVDAARNALLNEDLQGAERWIEAARAYGVNAQTVADLDEQLGMLRGLLGQ